MSRQLRIVLVVSFAVAQVVAPVAAQDGSGQVPGVSGQVDLQFDSAAPDSQSDLTVGAEASIEQLPVGDIAGGNLKALNAAPLTKENAVYLVRLQQDGKLLGQLTIVQPTGEAVPAQARISMEFAGKKVDWTETDADGKFQFESLKPGSYVATVTIEAGKVDFPVRVLPYDAQATTGSTVLDAALTPTPEVIYEHGFVSSAAYPLECGGCGNCPFCGVVVEEIIEPLPPCDLGCMIPPPCGGGFSGGCCCGGGGKGLGLLGLAGLATGITALALDDDCGDDQVASPAAP